ncbi:MAG: hypothetical protein ACRCZW_11615 [Lactobacillaceae bacterium]
MSDISFKYSVERNKEIKHYTFYVVDESKFFESIQSIENPSISNTDKQYILDLEEQNRNRFMVDTLSLIHSNPLNEWTKEQLDSTGIEMSDNITVGGIMQ